MWAADIAVIGKLMINKNKDILAIQENINFLVCEQESEQDGEQDTIIGKQRTSCTKLPGRQGISDYLQIRSRP